MNVEQILDVLDEMLDKSWSLPLSGGRCVVDAEKVRDLIDDIRINMPGEFRQAQSVVQDRADILAAARKEGETIIRKAEERAKALIANEEIVRSAQAKAADILTQAQMKAKEMRRAAHDFSDDTLKNAEDALIKSLTEVRGTRQALRGSAKQK